VSHTLLLADDSVTIQRVIELTFADEDIAVVAVSDGDQAIARLESAPPDIVLADIGMPGKSGYEVAQYIKKSPKLSKIPVVLLTGAFEPVDQARAAEAGCDGILAKPFEPQLVIARVKELLGTAPPRPADEGGREPATKPHSAAPASASEKNTSDYFDRLDAAFTSAAAAPPAALVNASKMPRPGARQAPAAKQEDMDLPIAQPKQAPAPADLPLAATAPAPPPAQAAPAQASTKPAAPEPVKSATDPETGAVTAAVPRVAAPSASAAPDTPAAPLPPQPIPSLADAFAALLAAEQAEPLPPSVPAWPASGPPSDLIAEQVTRRVLEQLSDKVVRETVTSLVSQIAERLVREEIEKIKASIK